MDKFTIEPFGSKTDMAEFITGFFCDETENNESLKIEIVKLSAYLFEERQTHARQMAVGFILQRNFDGIESYRSMLEENYDTFTQSKGKEEIK